VKGVVIAGVHDRGDLARLHDIDEAGKETRGPNAAG
jgi:hypothetical protein